MEENGEELERELSEAVEEFIKELPDEVRSILDDAATGDISEEEFIRLAFVGDCPSCESKDTTSCDEVEGIDDPTVAMCNKCSYLWCTECGMELEKGETCGHWDVCDGCEEPRDEFGECGVDPFDCPKIVEWIQAGEALASMGCSWCNSEIPAASDVFAVGAKLKEGIQVVTGEGEPAAALFNVMVGGRSVTAIVAAADSEARSQGNDLLFIVCSKECAEDLSRALESERETIERTSLN